MRWLRTVVPLALAGLIGCGSDFNVTLIPVTGRITQNGKPLADAVVQFIPDQGNKTQTPGSDSTGPEGNYMLRWQNRTGVAPGKYRVTVQPPFVLPSGAKVPEAFKDDPYMIEVAQKALAKDTKKAATGTKTEFEAEVTDKGGPFDFDVKTAPSTEAAKKQ